MRILFLSRYTAEGPSSRYRILQFIPHFQSVGIECVVEPFFRPGYLSLRFGNKRGLVLRTLRDYHHRLQVLRTAREFDLVVIEKEVFPYFPAVFEKGLLRNGPPLVLDYDDAVFHVYDSHANSMIRLMLGKKISQLMAIARVVVVGSGYLDGYARQYNEAVCFVPTAIDLRSYPAVPPLGPVNESFTIGWIGSSSTVKHLKNIESVLDKFCATHNARFVMIGGNSDPLGIRHSSRVPWSGDSEIESLSSLDVGIMPLPDTPLARGKCGFKLIQYMGCWKPVIASPVGENRTVVEHGINGFFADTPQQWFDTLETLLKNPALGQTMGIAGRAKVEAEYSSAIVGPRLLEILQQNAKGNA